MHAAPSLAKSPLISSYSSKKMFDQISVGYLLNDLQSIFTANGWMLYPINLPLSALARCWVPFRLSKHRLSNSLSQHQSNSQAELSKTTREDFRISKRKPEIFLNTYPYTNLAYNVMPAYLIIVTRSVAKRGSRNTGKTFSTLKKSLGHIVCITILFVHAIDVKFVSPSENYSPSMLSKAGYGSAGD